MQKILRTALIAGCLAGLVIFALQSFKLTPLILQAETYEETEAADHSHGAEAWEPANGFERNAYRLLADLGIGIGFALILISAFVLRGDPVDAKRGILWGLAGFAVFSLAPGFGLPPELPASLAGELSARQIWWLATTLATAFGLYALVFGKSPLFKGAGVIILTLPHLVGAPKTPLGGVVPTELNAQFAAASLVTMAIFWVILGGMSGWLYARQSSSKQASNSNELNSNLELEP